MTKSLAVMEKVDEDLSQVRIFPHSRDEFSSVDMLRMWLLNGLRGGGGIYLLRRADAVATLPIGSVVLFRYGNEIVGEAIVSEEKKVQQVTAQTLAGRSFEYAAQVTFAPSSIRLYSPAVDIQKIKKYVPTKNIDNAEPYYILDRDAYAAVLREVVSAGNFIS